MARACSCIFKAGDEERLHISRFSAGWLLAFGSLPFVGGRQESGQTVYRWAIAGVRVGEGRTELNWMIPNIPPFAEVFLLVYLMH